MNTEIEKYYKLIFISIFIFFASALIFFRIYSASDIPLHSQFAMSYRAGKGSLPSNFFYYITLLFIGGSSDLRVAATSLLSGLVVFKFFIIYKFLIENKSININKQIVVILSLFLLFLSPIYIPQLLVGRFYLGSFPQNIWHNSTIIAVMPFAIMLFLQTCQQLDLWSTKRLTLITSLIVINAVIKPSYLLVYVIALPFTAIILKKNIARNIFLAIFAFFVILIQYFYTYLIKDRFGQQNSIDILPFSVYQAWHPKSMSMIFIVILFTTSILLSCAFPIYVLVKKKMWGDTRSNFTIVSMIVALIMTILFAETGSRFRDGNFFWQVYICSFILFLVATAESLPELTQRPRLNWYRLNIYQILFGTHLIFGIIYVFRLIISQNYY